MSDVAARLERRPNVRQGTDVAGRMGLVSEAILYAVMGVLALHLVLGDLDEEADPTGAIATVGRQPFSRILLAALAIGFALNALWRLGLAARAQPSGEVGADEIGPDGRAKTGSRLRNAGRGVAYLGLAAMSGRVVMRAGGTRSQRGSGSGGAGEGEDAATAVVLGWPGGRLLVVAVGAALVIAGLWHWRQPVTRDFLDPLRTDSMATGVRRLVIAVGSIGYAARGLAFGIVGGFLIEAAVTYHADRAAGLDAALAELARTGFGRSLIAVVGVGFVAFAVYRALDAVYRSPTRT